MKRHLFAGVALLALAALPGCDAVRLPVFNPSGEASATAPASEAGAQAAPDTVEAQATAQEPAEAVTPTIDRGAPQAPDDLMTPDEAAATPKSLMAGVASPSQAVEAGPPGVTLEEMNAVICGLPADAPPTPTVGAVAGAMQTEEPAATAQAVNAMAASLVNFPGIVKLEPRRPEEDGIIVSGHCSAVRIADRWLVTAAHCVDQPFEELRIIGEAENLLSPLARVTQGEFAVCHGGYAGTANGYANDIALIRLTDEEVAALGEVPVARYGMTEKPLAPANYETGEMAGWGLTHFGGKLSNDLLAASIRITGAGPSAIYVASQGGAGPCVGDSGGPLYVTEEDGSRTAVGVLSVVEQNRDTGQFCAGDYNGRYTNLQGYRDWMTEVMALCDADENACK